MKKNWIGVIILAAGRSERFGKNKLLTDFKGKKLIEYTLEPYLSNQEIFRQIIVVLGSLKSDFKNLFKGLRLLKVYNQDYQTSGMSSSIKIGISKLLEFNLENCLGVLIHPADIPFVKMFEIKKLIEFENLDNAIIIPSFENHGGHPIFISKNKLKDLLDLTEIEMGLRGYLQKNKDSITYIEVESPRILFDIDKKDDLNEIERLFFS